MTTKEEKARLKSMRMLLVELINEFDEILGIAPSAFEDPQHKVLGTTTLSSATVTTKHDDPKGPMKIGDLEIGDTSICVEAEIISIERTEGKTKEEKRPYKKAIVLLNDETGAIPLVLWNEHIEDLTDAGKGDIVRVEVWKMERNEYSKKRELVYGKFGTINKVNIERHIL